jgi:hypothetical protein
MGRVDGRVGWDYNKHMSDKFAKRMSQIPSLRTVRRSGC